jgi:hypothetical protein
VSDGALCLLRMRAEIGGVSV